MNSIHFNKQEKSHLPSICSGIGSGRDRKARGADISREFVAPATTSTFLQQRALLSRLAHRHTKMASAPGEWKI